MTFSKLSVALSLALVHGRDNVTAEEMHRQLLKTAPENKVGNHHHCFGARAHRVTYNMAPDAESLKTCRNCVVMVRPSPELNHLCAPQPQLRYNSGCDPLKPATRDCPWQSITRDADLCFGLNVDSTCSKAKKSITLKDGWSCSNCFVALSADLYIDVVYIKSPRTGLFTDLGMAEVKVSNAHFRGNLEFFGKKGATKTVNGEYKFDFFPKSVFAFTAGTIPVKVEVSVPGALSWSASARVDASIRAGVAMDMEFTDTSARWLDTDNNQHGGVTGTKGKFKSVSIVPKLELKEKLGVDIDLAFKTGLEIELTDLLAYKINVVPRVPLKVTYQGQGWFGFGKKEACINANVDFDVSHQAQVHINGFFKRHILFQWPSNGKPRTVYHSRKPLLEKCLDEEDSAVTMV